jgi:D-3-phosphoglycerate dehydrogenase / 2-oxoglutarate reductase
MAVRAVFVDANECLASAAERIIRLDGLGLRINRQPTITPPEIPSVLDDAAIVIIDHTALPVAIARQYKGLRHVVFVGSGALHVQIRGF